MIFLHTFLKLGLAFFLFLLAAIYITFPLIFHLGDNVTAYGDELLIAWIHSWVIHALSTNPLIIFSGNLYYPYENTTAYSDLFLTTSILSFLPVKLIGQPIVANNFTFISSLVLLGFSVYLLTHYVTKNYLASLLSGFLVIFSPATLDKYVHIQMLAIEFVPLSILTFLIFLNSGKTRFLLITSLFFLLQTYNSFLPGYFILFSLLIALIVFWYSKKNKVKNIISKKNIFIVVLTLLFVVPVAIPYFKVSQEFHYVRDIRETIHFAMQPEDFIYPNAFTRLQPALINLSNIQTYPKNAEIKSGYIGLVFTILSILSLVFFRKIFKKKNIEALSFLYISLFGLLLSLGPFLHIARKTIHDPFPIPLPYLPLYYIIPGFQGFRNSARWEMLFVLGMAVLIGIFMVIFLKKMNKKLQYVVYIFLIVLIVAEYNFPMQFSKISQVNEFPPVYHWISKEPTDVKIIELPIYNWNMWPYTQNELFREYYSTIHFRKTVNGYSGFSPPPWQELVYTTMADFPSDKSIENLLSLGVEYIIIHKDEYDTLYKNKYEIRGKIIKNGNEINYVLIKNKHLILIKKFNNDFVYKLVQ